MRSQIHALLIHSETQKPEQLFESLDQQVFFRVLPVLAVLRLCFVCFGMCFAFLIKSYNILPARD